MTDKILGLSLPVRRVFEFAARFRFRPCDTASV
jgi:hypothetical protein